MKLKLLIVFLSVVLLMLMFGVGIAQGDNIGYPAPIEIELPDYPEPVELVGFYITSTPQLVSNAYQFDDGGYPVNEVADYSVGYPYPKLIAPQYVNGRNLWQEILFQFSKLLELMK